MIRLAALVAAAALLEAVPEPVCVHPARGETRRISLDRVRKAQEELKVRLAESFGRVDRLSPDRPYDSGLPACGARRRYTLRTDLPAELAGKTAAFAPAERMPRADVRVATSARTIASIDADALADEALVRRLGVRCAPTSVRFLSETELELVESP